MFLWSCILPSFHASSHHVGCCIVRHILPVIIIGSWSRNLRSLDLPKECVNPWAYIDMMSNSPEVGPLLHAGIYPPRLGLPNNQSGGCVDHIVHNAPGVMLLFFSMSCYHPSCTEMKMVGLAHLRDGRSRAGMRCKDASSACLSEAPYWHARWHGEGFQGRRHML